MPIWARCLPMGDLGALPDNSWQPSRPDSWTQTPSGAVEGQVVGVGGVSGKASGIGRLTEITPALDTVNEVGPAVSVPLTAAIRHEPDEVGVAL